MTLNDIFAEFKKLKNDKKAIEMSAYMKNQFAFLGISASPRKEIENKIFKSVSKENIDFKFTDKCYKNKYREFQYAAVDYLNFKKEYLNISHIEILKNYYGDSIYIDETTEISGIPSSYPGSPLKIGSSGEKVRQMQRQLNVIAGAYPLIPKIAEDGVFGPDTEEAVKVFQRIFGLTQDGIVGFKTWYKISEIYVGVSRIAELV